MIPPVIGAAKDVVVFEGAVFDNGCFVGVPLVSVGTYVLVTNTVLPPCTEGTLPTVVVKVDGGPVGCDRG